MAVWAVVACVVQLLTYLAARFTLPHLAQEIPAGQVASGLFLARQSATRTAVSSGAGNPCQ